MSNRFRFLMLGAMYENGGNTTHRFLDGHPQMYVYPYESQIGTRMVNDHMSSLFPVKYRWPVFALDATPEQDYHGDHRRGRQDSVKDAARQQVPAHAVRADRQGPLPPTARHQADRPSRGRTTSRPFSAPRSTPGRTTKKPAGRKCMSATVQSLAWTPTRFSPIARTPMSCTSSAIRGRRMPTPRNGQCPWPWSTTCSAGHSTSIMRCCGRTSSRAECTSCAPRT